VKAFQGLNYNVVAAGDSFNDVTMLKAANHGFFFHAPESIQALFPDFKAFDDYSKLLQAIESCLI
jgi:phosphoserine/homoserine phosphotransferase